jgi:type IX secretion system PorP/SprF family membrane protein
MKKIFITGLCCLSFCFSFSQQDPMYSQYLYNMLAVNPAYAGSREAVSSTFFYRNQWTGFEGAPVTANLSAHAPFAGTKGAWGVNLMNDRIGVQSQTMLNLSYAYRIFLPSGNLSFGMSGGFYNFSYNWNELNLQDMGDAAFAGRDNVMLLNMGAGIYYQTGRMALSFSSPHLINQRMIQSRGYNVTRPFNHYFAAASYLLPVNDLIALKPSVMVKMVKNAPVQGDINMTLIYKKSLYLGASYRTMNELNLMAQYQLNKNWWFGYAYDIPFSKVGYVSRGSHEVFIGYEFTLQKNKLLSPRYF